MLHALRAIRHTFTAMLQLNKTTRAMSELSTLEETRIMRHVLKASNDPTLKVIRKIFTVKPAAEEKS
jgi:hypothetical protein